MDRGQAQITQAMKELMAHPGSEAAARLSGCENFVDAMGHGNTVTLRDWGVTLNCIMIGSVLQRQQPWLKYLLRMKAKKDCQNLLHVLSYARE